LIRRPLANRRRGQSLVEFAIFVPVLLTVLLTAVDVGRVYLGWVSLTNIARIGANFAAQNPTAWSGTGDVTVQARYRTLMAKDALGIDCGLPSPLPAPEFMDSAPNKYLIGSRVRVDLTCTFNLVMPFLNDLIGDGAGHLTVGTSATYTIRTGSVDGVVVGGTVPGPTPEPSPTPGQTTVPTPTPNPTSTPDPTATFPGATPTPTPMATPTPEPPVIAFYGSSTDTDSYGGGPPGAINESQVVGLPTLSVDFTNTTTGPEVSCVWTFGDGVQATGCSDVAHTYLNLGTYSVTLAVDGYALTRSDYVLLSCQVPAFSGVRKNSAASTWAAAGFATSDLTTLSGNGNYKIGYQSVAGGMVNPDGGCSGAAIQVGP
jgi:hypothetical protein